MPNNIYFKNVAYNKSPSACQLDSTPPTFSGVQSLTPNADGTITVNWNTATDLSSPIYYEVFIALGSVPASNLFALNPTRIIRGAITTRVGLLHDQATYLLNGQIYTIGVRARDGVGNLNTNTSILTTTAIGSGNLASVFQTISTSLTAASTNFDSNLVTLDSEITALSTNVTDMEQIVLDIKNSASSDISVIIEDEDEIQIIIEDEDEIQVTIE